MEKKSALTIADAVENLSNMAEMDVEDPKEERSIKWLNPEEKHSKQLLVKESLKTVTSYLKNVYQEKKDSFKDPTMQRGVQAMMLLAGEAAQKIDKFSHLFQDSHHDPLSVTELDEFKELQDFYLTKIAKKFEETLQEEEAWTSEWGNIEESALDLEKRSLKDLQTVKRDRDYELFYLRKADGKPFFNRNLIRHIRLVADIDELCKDPEGEDFSSKVKLIVDKRLHFAASSILHSAKHYIDRFYKEALRHKDLSFVVKLNCALMALMCASNPRNLLQNTNEKSSLTYFLDFQTYLRSALKSDDYYYFVVTPPKQEQKFSVCLMNLVHRLSFAFFTHRPFPEEMTGFLYRLLEKEQLLEKGGQFLNMNEPLSGDTLLEVDEAIRSALAHYPNGPLIKTLSLFTGVQTQLGFDSLMQGNTPSALYTIHLDQKPIHCLRLPSPTRQMNIEEVEIAVEFKAFFQEDKELSYLLFDLQDRTRLEEFARSKALLALSHERDLKERFRIVAFAKYTPFYLQAEEYLEIDAADLFLKTFLDQLQSGDSAGFFFPSPFLEDLTPLFEPLMKMVHKTFFGSKQTLPRKERLDFIEIYYAFLSLKCLEIGKPDYFSFTCKDAIDAGSASSVFFYLFIQLLQGTLIGKNQRDLILWMLYDPAMCIRERAIDVQRVHRIISAFSVLHGHHFSEPTVWKKFAPFYSLSLENIKIEEATS